MHEPDSCTCLKPCKYVCFRKVPPFQLIRYFGVPKDGLGPHFERFWGTLGVILVVFEGPGKAWNFDVF